MRVCNPYLASRDELQRSQGALHVWDVRLEIVQCARDTGFQFRGILSGRTGRRNLIEVSHDCGLLWQRGW